MTIVRDHDALLALIEQVADKPFAWRDHHCVRFAARAVAAQTGRDPMAGIVCRSKREAVVLLEQEGGLEAAVDRRLRRIAPALAARGDIAGVVDEEFGVRLMVVEGATLVGPGATGQRRVPRGAMIMAWSVEAAD
jgi:hypothetical protein